MPYRELKRVVVSLFLFRSFTTFNSYGVYFCCLLARLYLSDAVFAIISSGFLVETNKSRRRKKKNREDDERKRPPFQSQNRS